MTVVRVNEHNLDLAGISHNDHRIHCLGSVEQASGSDLGRIFSLSPLPTIVLDARLQVVQVSNSHLTFSGYSRTEVVGRSIYDLPAHKVPATDTINLHPAITYAINKSEVQIIDDIVIGIGIERTVYTVSI